MIKVFRLITNIWFYIGIVFMLALLFFFSKNDVLSFRWLPSLSVSTTMKQIDTTYIIKQKIADNAILLTYANIAVGHNASNYSSNGVIGLEDINGTITNKALLLVKNLGLIRSTNVFQLSNSQGGNDGLSTLLQQGQITLSESQIVATTLEGSISEAQSQVDGCVSQKSKADELYRQGLELNNSTMVDQATTSAKEASSCISNYGVSVKSMNGILINLKNEIEKTQKYITLVNNNQTLIKDYNNLLDGDVPSQLVELQKQFNSL